MRKLRQKPGFLSYQYWVFPTTRGVTFIIIENLLSRQMGRSSGGDKDEAEDEDEAEPLGLHLFPFCANVSRSTALEQWRHRFPIRIRIRIRIGRKAGRQKGRQSGKVGHGNARK